MGGSGCTWHSSVGARHGGCCQCGVLCPGGTLVWVRSSGCRGCVSSGGSHALGQVVEAHGMQLGVSGFALERCSVGCLWGHPASWRQSGDMWPSGDRLRGVWEMYSGVMLSWMQWGHAGDVCVSGETPRRPELLRGAAEVGASGDTRLSGDTRGTADPPRATPRPGCRAVRLCPRKERSAGTKGSAPGRAGPGRAVRGGRAEPGAPQPTSRADWDHVTRSSQTKNRRPCPRLGTARLGSAGFGPAAAFSPHG